MAVSKDPTPSRPPEQRKPYIAPQLTCYGNVKGIVQGDGGMMNDGGADMSRPCWVAEALYGVDDPRTLMLRSWMSQAFVERRRWWFLVWIYMKCGRMIGSLIQRQRVPRRWLLPLFEFLARRAFDETADRGKAASPSI